MPLQFAMYLSPVACLGACMWLLVFREFSKYVDKNDDMIKKFIKRRKIGFIGIKLDVQCFQNYDTKYVQNGTGVGVFHFI
jgi:hypothetical protein